MKNLNEEALKLLKKKTEDEFMTDVIDSDLWKLFEDLLQHYYPMMIQLGVYSSSSGYVIDSKDDLKSFLFMLLHKEDDDNEEYTDE